MLARDMVLVIDVSGIIVVMLVRVVILSAAMIVARDGMR